MIYWHNSGILVQASFCFFSSFPALEKEKHQLNSAVFSGDMDRISREGTHPKTNKGPL